MKILVTGGSGFIGSTLIRQLNERGVGVRALLRNPAHPNLVGLQYEVAGGDLLKPESLEKAVRGVQGVIHLAGVVSAFREQDYVDGNVKATQNLVAAIAKVNPEISKFVLVSSLAAGGPSLIGKPRNENDQDSPVSLYGKSKREGEQTLKNAPFPWIIVRPPMVYGPRDKGCYLFFKSAKFPLAPTFRKKEYSIIFSEDLCEGVIESFFAQSKNEIFYFSNLKIYTYSELMKGFASGLGRNPFLFPIPDSLVVGAARICHSVSEITGKSFALNRDKINEIKPDAWTCNSEKAKSQLGFEPRHSLEEGAKITAKWYREHGWL